MFFMINWDYLIYVGSPTLSSDAENDKSLGSLPDVKTLYLGSHRSAKTEPSIHT